MNKDSKDFEVFHLRSVGASIRDGYRLYMDHFRRIFRSTWLVALIYALIIGIASSFLVKLLPQLVFLHSAGMPQQELLVPGLSICAIYILISLAAAMLYAVGFSMLNRHQTEGIMPTASQWYGYIDKKSTLRTLIVWGSLLIIAIFTLLLNGMLLHFLQQYLSSIAYNIVGIIIVIGYILAAPILLMICIRYILSEGKRLFTKLAPRYWGSTILVTIVITIVTELLSIITELPTNILTIANIQSQMGLLKGDPVGTPDYITWLNLIAFTIAGFIKAYVILSAIFPFYYLNGSILTQEKERKELAQKFNNI